jgi:TolB-like protein/Tfp pilus assembly protein PilF
MTMPGPTVANRTALRLSWNWKGRFQSPLVFLTANLISASDSTWYDRCDAWRDQQGRANLLYLFENYVLDTDRRELRRGDSQVSMEPQVFDVMEYLIRNRERVVTKDDLVASIWDGRIVSESALTTRINAVRRALDDSGQEQRLIKTLPRKGIRFVGAVTERTVPAGAAATPPSPAVANSNLALPEGPSIAVLPFANLSGDPEQDYFADGMAEEIITALSRCNWLFVIARNSSFIYKGRSVDVRQVGRELGVRYVLEGSVRRGGNRLRFTGQLVDASSGAHIWADRFDGDMSDVFELQDRFTQSVVAAIEPSLQLAEIERLKNKPTSHLDAYDLMLRAQQLESEFTDDSLAAALRCLNQALAIDPSYAPAMALAAYCYGERRIQGWTKDPSAEDAEGLRLASRAVELGKNDGNVMWMAAYAVWRLTQDAQRARELAHRSLRLNPNSAIALAISAWTEMQMGRPDKAIELYGRAERLSPQDPRGWLLAAGLGAAHFMAGHFEEAVTSAEAALVQNPRFTVALRVLAASQARLGHRDKAAAAVRELLKVEPQLTLAELRSRIRFLDETSWGRAFVDALRLAGLPE